VLAVDGTRKTRPFKTHEAARDLEKETELQMSFLPKTAETRQEFLSLLIAIPLSLVGTGFLFFILDSGTRLI
jgi:LPXTG-motif cell wall-anchored protein